MRAHAGDIVPAAVLAGLGCFIMFEARGWEYAGPDGPGPGFFPLWYGAAMIALSLALIATSVSARLREERRPVRWREVGDALGAWAGFAACVGLLKVLGFVLAFGLFTFFLVAVLYGRPLGVALAVAAGTAGGFYVVFALALNIVLPVGRLGL